VVPKLTVGECASADDDSSAAGVVANAFASPKSRTFAFPSTEALMF